MPDGRRPIFGYEWQWIAACRACHERNRERDLRQRAERRARRVARLARKLMKKGSGHEQVSS